VAAGRAAGANLFSPRPIGAVPAVTSPPGSYIGWLAASTHEVFVALGVNETNDRACWDQRFVVNNEETCFILREDGSVHTSVSNFCN
jgi:hypothetical protein